MNRTFVQTSRGCHQGGTFCAEPLMNGLKFRCRPVDEVINEMEKCGARTISTGTLTWYEMKKANRIVSFDWSMYDQGHVVYRPAQMSADELPSAYVALIRVSIRHLQSQGDSRCAVSGIARNG